MNTLWTAPVGRELDATPLDDTMVPSRIVACLNVWNDLPALKQTLPTWMNYVHHIIAVDGAYEQTGHALSTDGTRELLQTLPNCTLIDAPGLSQCEKRTRYLQAGRAGDTLFVIDADESVVDTIPTTFSHLPICDVGWVRVNSALYTRIYGQPRLLRWRPDLHYRGRHHWIYEGERLVCTHQYGGTGYSHRPVNITLHNQRRLGRAPDRMTTKHTHHEREIAKERVLSAIPESVMSDSALGKREALWILNFAYRDDGMAPSRLHTAINRTTPHSSVFVKTRPGPFSVPEQYLTTRHKTRVQQASSTADILHFHGVMSVAKGARPGTPVVFHHHGTLFRNNAKDYMAQAKAQGALVLLSNLELYSWTGDEAAYFLPNTVPVARYAELAAIHRPMLDSQQLFRIAHSPSQRHRKGTDDFLKVCAHLQSINYPLEPVLIEGQTHKDALRMKATCHAMFDSFWLGMQCSGIEAAAMGMPVIAGDKTVAARYVERFGAVPYTFADSAELLEDQIKRFVESTEYRLGEAHRVFRHVCDYHDESAVALKYLDLLDGAFGWRDGHLRRDRRYVRTAR